MKYWLCKRGKIYYSFDSETGQRDSLRTSDKEDAARIIHAKNAVPVPLHQNLRTAISSGVHGIIPESFNDGEIVVGPLAEQNFALAQIQKAGTYQPAANLWRGEFFFSRCRDSPWLIQLRFQGGQGFIFARDRAKCSAVTLDLALAKLAIRIGNHVGESFAIGSRRSVRSPFNSQTVIGELCFLSLA